MNYLFIKNVINWSMEIPFVSFSKMGAGANAAKYLTGQLEKNRVADYYSSEHVGQLYDPHMVLAEFGLKDKDEVTTEQFERLCAGNSLSNGEFLLGGKPEEHVAGNDFTFSPPKQWGAAWAVADPELKAIMEKIERAAVRDGLDLLNDKSAITRVGKSGKDVIKTRFVAVQYHHSSSRNNNPQPHFHNAILNLCKGPSGKWLTIENGMMLRWKTAADAIYQGSLVAGLKEAFPGVQVGYDELTMSFTIDGVPTDLADLWSSRRKQIEELAREGQLNLGDPKIMAHLALKDRAAKTDLPEDQHEFWRQQAAQFNFTAASAREIMMQPVTHSEQVDIRKVASEAANTLFEHEAVVSEAAVVRAVGNALMEHGVSARIVRSIAEKILVGEIASDALQRVGDDNGMAVFSTKSIIAAENAVLDGVRDLVAKADFHDLAPDQIKAAISKSGLKGEQAEAAKIALSPDRFSIIRGWAGSGKSFTARTVKSVLESTGAHVIGLAQSWQAAGVLKESAHLAYKQAIAGFLRSAENFGVPPNTVLLVDEAGLVGVRDMAALIAVAQKYGCKIVLMGDEKQLNPVSAGAALRLCMQESGQTGEISTIRRQKEEWARAMVKDFATGHSDSALRALDDHGGLKFCTNDSVVRELMISDWTEASKTNPEGELLLLAVRKVDVAKLNDAARKNLKQAGELKGPDVMLRAIGAEHFTQKKAGIKKENRVAGFCQGDRIVFCMKGTEAKDGKGNIIKGDASLVENRTRAVILAIDKDKMAVELLDNDGKLTGDRVIVALKKFHKPDQPDVVAIAHAYAMTGWSSQGVTVDRTFVASSGMDRRYGYVCMSRHRHEANLYVDTGRIKQSLAARGIKATDKLIKTELARDLHVNSHKNCALDYINGAIVDIRKKAKLSKDELLKAISNSPWAAEKIKRVTAKVSKAKAESIAKKKTHSKSDIRELWDEVKAKLSPGTIRKLVQERVRLAGNEARQRAEREEVVRRQNALKQH